MTGRCGKNENVPNSCNIRKTRQIGMLHVTKIETSFNTQFFGRKNTNVAANENRKRDST